MNLKKKNGAKYVLRYSHELAHPSLWIFSVLLTSHFVKTSLGRGAVDSHGRCHIALKKKKLGCGCGGEAELGGSCGYRPTDRLNAHRFGDANISLRPRLRAVTPSTHAEAYCTQKVTENLELSLWNRLEAQPCRSLLTISTYFFSKIIALIPMGTLQ